MRDTFGGALPQNRPFVQKLEWTGDDEFRIGHVHFKIDTSQDRLRETSKLILSKGIPYLRAYFEQIDLSEISNVLEIGFFRGGSSAFFLNS